MERLTRICPDTMDGKYVNYVAGDFIGIYPDCTLGKVVKRLAYYEDLEEQGQLMVLPCKIGSTIYQVKEKCTCTVGYYFLHNSGCSRPTPCQECPAVQIKRWIIETTFDLGMLDRIGDDFFLTREEAEAKIEEVTHGQK